MTRLIIFLLLTLFTFSCVDPPDFSNSPVISFNSISVTGLDDEIGSNVNIILDFQDGDGDLGLGNEDSTTFGYRFNFYNRNEDGFIIDTDNNVYTPFSKIVFDNQFGISHQLEDTTTLDLGNNSLINLITNEIVPYQNLTVEGNGFKDACDSVYNLNTNVFYQDPNRNLYKITNENGLFNLSTGLVVPSDSIMADGDDFIRVTNMDFRYTQNTGNIFLDELDSAFVLDFDNNQLVNIIDNSSIVKFSDIIYSEDTLKDKTKNSNYFFHYIQPSYIGTNIDGNNEYYRIDGGNNLINFNPGSILAHREVPFINLIQDNNKLITDFKGNTYNLNLDDKLRNAKGEEYKIDSENNLINIETGEIVPASKVLNRFHYNYIITSYKKVGESFEEVLGNGYGNLRYPKLFSEDNIGGALEGELELDFRIGYFDENAEVQSGDIMKFDIYILDRNLNESNIITTDEVTLVD